LRKALLARSGVLADPDGQAVADTAMWNSAAQGFRGFLRHLSNQDLMRLWLQWPAAGARWWRAARANV
jgi:hypothetical protein